MLEKRTKILQTKLLCAKACRIKKKEDKSLRGTDGTHRYANLILMRNNSVVIHKGGLGQVLQNRRRNRL